LRGASSGDRVMATDLEAALRREIRSRREAERVVRQQSEAMTKTLELLGREPALPDFIRALLRSITRHCGGLWTSFWVIDEKTGEGKRTYFQWHDQYIGRAVEGFANTHARQLQQLGRHYKRMLLEEGGAILTSSNDRWVAPAMRQFYRAIGVTGVLVIPLHVGRKLVGWMSHHRGEAPLGVEQMAFIEGMARQAALAFQLAQLSEAKHEAERALEEQRLAREQETELLTINRLLHVTPDDPQDRLGAVLRDSLDHVAELLHGKWASLWRYQEGLDFAVPAWLGAAGHCARVPAKTGLKIADACRAEHRKFFGKLRKSGEIQAMPASAPPVRGLLSKMEVAPPAGRGARLVHVPLWFDGESLGFMLVLTENPPETGSRRYVAAHALALQAALTLALDEMSTVQRSSALAEERNRIARNLHDLLAQSFTGIVLQVEAMRAECPQLPEEVMARLEKIRFHAAHSAEDLRRTLSLLQPAALDQCALPAAIAMLAHETEARTGVSVKFQNRAAALALDARADEHLYAIISEALQNALAHARPRRISISLKLRRGCLVVTVVNDGILPAATRIRMPGRRRGLANIRERVLEMGARFSLSTQRDLTRLEISIPLSSSKQNGNGSHPETPAGRRV